MIEKATGNRKGKKDKTRNPLTLTETLQPYWEGGRKRPPLDVSLGRYFVYVCLRLISYRIYFL